MEREIRFRGWNPHDKVIVSWEDIKKHKGYIYDFLHDIKENLILMQYTGLKDKNGKEIYEGDVLREKFNDGNTTQTHDIFTFYWENGAYTDGEWYFADMDFTEIEIIGNIYENPDLLTNK